MSPLRLSGSTSGYSQLDAPAIAGDQTFTLPSTGGTLDRLNRAGNVLQVVQTVKTDTFSTASSSFVDVTGLSAQITPTSSSNKVLAQFFVTGGTSADSYTCVFQLVRDSTAIGIADSAGSRVRSTTRFYSPSQSHGQCSNAVYLDSPSTTSQITYKVQMAVQSGATGYINRAGTDTDSTLVYFARSISSLVLMEVAA